MESTLANVKSVWPDDVHLCYSSLPKDCQHWWLGVLAKPLMVVIYTSFHMGYELYFFMNNDL